jgi:hypothetical protein
MARVPAVFPPPSVPTRGHAGDLCHFPTCAAARGSSGGPARCGFVDRSGPGLMEAASGLEPEIEVLQTSALATWLRRHRRISLSAHGEELYHLAASCIKSDANC